MHIRFTHKAWLMTSMREAVIAVALMIMMLHIAITPAVAKQQSGDGQPPTAATQQGSVSLPPATTDNGSGSGDNSLAGGNGDNSTTNQNSTTPKDNALERRCL